MVDYQYKNVNGENIKLTDAEIKELQDRDTAYAAKSGERKLDLIKQERDLRLKATDYMANSDYTMPDYIKTWRQTLRDLPQNNTTESQYDTLLAKDADGNLTNSVWTQPTE